MAYIGQIKDRNGNVVYPKTVVGALTDYTPLNISQPSTLGIAYLNGSFDSWANGTHYRTIELPDARLVSLSVHLQSTTPINSSNKHKLAVLSVPSNIRPLYAVDAIQGAMSGNGTNGMFVLELGGDGIITAILPETYDSNSGTGYHGEFLYLAVKN